MKQWRCTVCGYIHIGDKPPEVCPVCGAGPDFFEPLLENVDSHVSQAGSSNSRTRSELQQVLFMIPCGLFIIGSILDNKPNAMVNNTLFQITDQPLQVLLGMDKRHLTTEYIQKSRVFSVNFVGVGQLQIVKRFGFKSGRDSDKFSGISWHPGQTGAPILDDAPGYLECRVQSVPPTDAGTHLVFLAEVTNALRVSDASILTYQEYRRRKEELWVQDK